MYVPISDQIADHGLRRFLTILGFVAVAFSIGIGALFTPTRGHKGARPSPTGQSTITVVPSTQLASHTLADFQIRVGAKPVVVPASTLGRDPGTAALAVVITSRGRTGPQG